MRDAIAACLESGSWFAPVLTLGAYFVGRWVAKKTGLRALNPIVTAIALVIGVLCLTGIEYESYSAGTQLLTELLGPATVALAVPLYRQIEVLRRSWWLILISVACGVVSVLLLILGLSVLLRLDPVLYRSILAKSVTTAIALGITTELGAYTELTVFSVILTGILGACFGFGACRLLRIRDPIARGLAVGTASHAIGTSAALAEGEIEGSMSGLALAVAGILTVIAAPYFGRIL